MKNDYLHCILFFEQWLKKLGFFLLKILSKLSQIFNENTYYEKIQCILLDLSSSQLRRYYSIAVIIALVHLLLIGLSV